MITDYFNKIAKLEALNTFNEYFPIIRQTAKSSSLVVRGTITAIASDGKITVQTDTGKEITDLICTSPVALSVGTEGTVMAESLFIP